MKKPVCKQGWDGGHKLSIEVEAQPVPQKTTKSHETSPSASRVKQRQQEGTEPHKGTVRERKRASPADSRRTAIWQGPWSTVASHSTNHTVSEQRHGREDTGRGAQGEDGQARNPATNNALRTAKLSVGLRSIRGEEGERSSEKSDPWSVRHPRRWDGWGGTGCGCKRPSLPTWVAREEGGQGAPGDPPTVGHVLVQQPRGADEKRARCWDYHGFDVRDGDVEDQGRPARQHSRTKPRGQDEKGARAGTIVAPSKTNHGEITLDLSAAGRSGGRGKTRKWLRKTGGQDDRQEKGEAGGGSYG